MKYPCASSSVLFLIALGVCAGVYPGAARSQTRSGGPEHICPCLEHRANEPVSFDAAAHAACAGVLESQGRTADALQAWKIAIEFDPLMEAAHFGVVHILLERGDFPGAERAADAGLQADPKSARLYLAKALAEEGQDRWYEARRTITRGVAAVTDIRLLRHAAYLEDQFGRSAARAYSALAVALEGAGDSTGEYLSALARGREVSLRADDLKEAAWFESRLKAAGRLESSLLPAARAKNPANGTWIPGGTKALMRVVRGNELSTPERFLVDYCRSILGVLTSTDAKIARANLGVISEHFRRISALEAFGRREGNRVTITMSLDGGKAREATGQILHLIGWQIRYSREGISVEAWEEGSAWRSHDAARVLGIDQLSMQETLQAGGSFGFDIVDDWVPVLFDEDVWRSQVNSDQDLPGGLAEAFAGDPRLAETYVGLSALDKETAAALVGAVGMNVLTRDDADLLSAYSSSLAVRNGRAVVPGGEAGEAVWERIAGASPRDPGRFFGALLGKDDGKLVAFFFALTELDMRHQRFFTRNIDRTRRFYELFRTAPDMQGGARRTWKDTPFIDFLADIPLDPEGHVRFPGGPEVWILARGQSNSSESAARLLKKLPAIAAPEVEDEVLQRLARMSYRVGGYDHSELNNFLAVVHLEAHRTEPLDGDAALILAQEFTRFESVWPYFSTLTGLGRDEYAAFFAMSEKLRRRDGVELNRILGQVHSLIKLICMAKQAGRLDEGQSAELFALLCRRFSGAASARDFTEASLDLVRELLARAGAGNPSRDPDECLETILLGGARPDSLERDDADSQLPVGGARHDYYRRVLKLQAVPTLRALFEIYDIARAGGLDLQVLTLEKAVAALPNVNLPGLQGLSGKETECLESFRTARPISVVGRLRALSAAGKPDPKSLDRLSGELLAALNPQVELALAGAVYACYLRPWDLLVSEDPLFLRRHRFIDFDSLAPKRTMFLHSLLVQRQTQGSYFLGGFADFGGEAGKIALAGSRMADARSYSFAAAQIASLRATRWDLIRDDDLRLLGLKIRAAREWIVHAALDPEVMQDLAGAAAGILSTTRRADLLHSLDARDWHRVWKDVTLGDLYFLSDEYLNRRKTDPWNSPTMKALRELLARDNGRRLQWLGPILSPLFNCGHPHLVRLPPYEHFEKFLIPDKVAVRASEFKLYLGEYLDRRGLPAGVLEAVAEPLMMEILREVHLTDIRDWRAILAAYAGLDDRLMLGALKRQ